MGLLFEKFATQFNQFPVIVSNSMDLRYQREDALREISQLLKDVRVLVLDGSILRDEHANTLKKGDEGFEETLELLLRSAQTDAHEGIMRAQAEVAGIALEGQAESETVDLPFKTVFIEGLNDETIAQNNTNTATPYGVTTSIVSRKGLLVHEIEPESYKVFALVEERLAQGGELKPKKTTIEACYLNEQTLSNQLDGTVFLLYRKLKNIFNKIRTNPVEYGSENVNIRFRVGSGQDREPVKIKSVVHIRLKRKESAALASTDPRRIEWSHKWEVRGHWRKISGIGKDRDSRYTIKGFTWVIPYVKGPEEKQLVTKVRLVKPSSSDTGTPA
jgi:hypothetical protein